MMIGEQAEQFFLNNLDRCFWIVRKQTAELLESGLKTCPNKERTNVRMFFKKLSVFNPFKPFILTVSAAGFQEKATENVQNHEKKSLCFRSKRLTTESYPNQHSRRCGKREEYVKNTCGIEME